MVDTDAAARRSLPTELHAATRTEHANLNRMIMARLPLCLPGATSDPALYTYGMVVFSQIYYAIEEAWDTLLRHKDISEDQRILLNKINFPQLRRKHRLDTSLARLSSRCDAPTQAQLPRLRTTVFHFRDYIVEAIIAKPHLILAHTWTMYLALFNGGRHMAKQLLSAGPSFWQEEDRAAVVQGPLSFWFFGDDETYDGEDLKLAFKDAFNQVSEQLTDVQRNDVIAESKKLFTTCLRMVDFLDQHVQAQVQVQMQAQTCQGDEALNALHPDFPNASAPVSRIQTESAQGYLAAFTPSSALNFWHSLVSLLPSSQSTLPTPIRQEIEQKTM